MAKSTVFVDSSVIIAALLSSTGGSFYLLTQCRSEFQFQINEYILTEVQEILHTKFDERPTLLKDLFLLLGVADITVISDPKKSDVKRMAKAISENDAPILASALQSSDYLVTLDNEFLGTSIMALARRKSLLIVKPKDLLEAFRERQAA